MKSIPKIAFICILSIILVTFLIDCQQHRTPNSNELCNRKTLYPLNVSHAFTLGNYIIMIAKLESGLKSDVAFPLRVYHLFDKKAYHPERALYYEANKWSDLEKYVDLEYTPFIFTTTNMEPIFFKPQQKSETIAYFLKNSRVSKDREPLSIQAFEFDDKENSVSGSQPNFTSVNNKTVFDFNEPEFDETGEANLKLLFAHFPRDVIILDLVILERKIGAEFMYHSLVYTKEEYKIERTLNYSYVRHYLKGKKEVFTASVGRQFSRIIWEFDYNYRNDLGATNVCTKIDSKTDKLTAVTVAYSEHLNGSSYIYHLIEYYGTQHKYLYLSIADNGTLSMSENSPLILNKEFIQCNVRPPPFRWPPSDCRKNNLFEDQESDGVDESDSKQENDSESYLQKIWSVLAIIAMVIGIIALISYGIYSLVSVNKQNSKQ